MNPCCCSSSLLVGIHHHHHCCPSVLATLSLWFGDATMVVILVIMFPYCCCRCRLWAMVRGGVGWSRCRRIYVVFHLNLFRSSDFPEPRLKKGDSCSYPSLSLPSSIRLLLTNGPVSLSSFVIALRLRLLLLRLLLFLFLFSVGRWSVFRSFRFAIFLEDRNQNSFSNWILSLILSRKIILK